MFWTALAYQFPCEKRHRHILAHIGLSWSMCWMVLDIHSHLFSWCEGGGLTRWDGRFSRCSSCLCLKDSRRLGDHWLIVLGGSRDSSCIQRPYSSNSSGGSGTSSSDCSITSTSGAAAGGTAAGSRCHRQHSRSTRINKFSVWRLRSRGERRGKFVTFTRHRRLKWL